MVAFTEQIGARQALERGIEEAINWLTFGHSGLDVPGDEAVYSDTQGPQLCG